MSFEVKEKDLLGRIGKLKTKSGTVETPLLFPVINPSVQPVLPQLLKDVFGFEAVITNAYILKKRFKNRPVEEGLHSFLGFNGATMTDSGAYQILVYGGVEYDQKEIVAYEEGIGTDIATILDIPTGWRVNRAQAELTVAETHRRAKDFFNIKSREDILWVGPVQGGKHLDLVVESAKVMGSLPFDIHALGSPTEVMENYRYDVLAEMILATKRGIPIERPLHLFGAGHPSMFAIAVALGCDLFDSAAYALYAREGRYMTENGTWRLSEMDYFPCTCPKCVTETPKSLISKTPKEREIFLAEHNLWACMAELRRIKQAIRDGRLWELTEMRAHNHPALLSALKRIKNHKDFLATFSPSIKSRGFFYLNHEGIARPEIIQYSQRLLTRYTPPSNAQTLLLLPQTRNKPFHKAPEMKKIRQLLHLLGPELADKLHLAVFCAPFGVVPFELDEVYPLSQHETALPLDKETIEYVAQQTAQYIKQMPYKSVTLLNSYKLWNNHIQTAAQNACTEKNIPYNTIETGDISDKQLITNLKEILQKQLLPLLQPTTNTQL